VARGEHDEAADEEGDDCRDHRRHDAARPLVEGEPLGDARGVIAAVPRLLGLLARERLDPVARLRLDVAHATASSSRAPPVMAIPISSSLTVGGYSAAMRPS
jgi:hypothetical protein